jgi:hypothetical protein
MGSFAELKHKFHSVWPLPDERTRRIMAASEAIGLGYGGVSLIRRACGLSRKAIAKGITEIQAGEPPWAIASVVRVRAERPSPNLPRNSWRRWIP